MANWLALFFSIGTLLSILFLAFTSDLAFSWSTSVDATPRSVKQVTDTLSIPWRSFVPSAVPSIEMIEVSQYFRIADVESLAAYSSELAAWWKFLFCALFFYAFLPRVLSYICVSLSLKRSISRQILADSGVRALLDRIEMPYLSLSGQNTVVNNTLAERFIEASDGSQTKVSQENKIPVHQISLDTPLFLWAYSDFAVNSILLKEESESYSGKIYNVGGRNSTDEDSDSIKKFLEENSVIKNVTFIARSWEPPTRELVDFIRELLKKVESEISIILLILPLGYPERGKYREIDVKAWQFKLSSLRVERVILKRIHIE